MVTVAAGGDPEIGIKDWLAGKRREEVLYDFKRRLEDLCNFWKQNYKEFSQLVTSLDALPIYSVSRPMYLRRQFTSAGLYVDMIVCHDEALSGLRNVDLVPREKKLTLVANLLRDYIDLLSMESCFVADLDLPFAVLCPGQRDFDPRIEERVIDQSLELTTQYANDLLDAKCTNWEEVCQKTEKIIGAEAIKKAIRRPVILPAPFREPRRDYDRLSQCFERMRVLQTQSQAVIPSQPVLKDLLVSFLTEFSVMESQLHGSVELDLAPLHPRYTWDLYKWRVAKGNLDNARALGWEERQTSAVATAIQHEDLDWLSNVPLDAVIQLRNEGFLEEFRTRIRLARKRMTLEEGSDFSRIAQSVEREIESAIKEHVSSIASLEKDARKRLKVETGKFVGKVSVGIASFLIPPLSILGLVEDTREHARAILDTRKLLKSIPEKIRRGPWGLLMEARTRKAG